VLQKHADDLVQETFLKTFRALPNYDPVRSRLSTYVTAIGHNVLIDFLRHGRRMRDATVSLEDSIYCLQAQAEQDPAFLFRVAEALVDRLVDPSRIALARDLLLGVDPSEVATKHGVKPNQVYSIRSELRAILRDVASDLSFPGAKRFSRADEK
jgi:RNA polymerase sigma factor (sigma-70 family)